MTVPEILQQLERIGAEPPLEAMQAAVEQREAITPELIAAIERVTAEPGKFLTDRDYMLHECALYLLAQFRERGALEAVIRFLSLPGEQALDLTGDMVTEDGAQVLVSLCGADPEPLLRLAKDETINEFVRGEAIGGLAVQAAWGLRTREEVVEDLRQLFNGGLTQPGDGYVWAALAGTAYDFNAAELLPEIRRAYELGLVNESIIGLDWIERRFQTEGREAFERFVRQHQPITDAADMISSWVCFHEDDWPPPEADEAVGHAAVLPPPVQPIYSAPKPYVAPHKIGRNEPCPCGSGRKYKKCCGKGGSG